jgi:hypothetical protein
VGGSVNSLECGDLSPLWFDAAIRKKTQLKHGRDQVATGQSGAKSPHSKVLSDKLKFVGR